MLAITLSIVSLVILFAELWLGIVVIGWQGDKLFLERSKTPGPYWMMMALHATFCIGLPTFAFIVGV